MASNSTFSFAKNKQSGFTLIETIIGIVVFSISLALVINLIVPADEQSADNVHQIKAAELGQGMLDEILGRAFDNNSDMVGSIWRCDEKDEVGKPNRSKCTDVAGPEGSEVGRRSLFNDVDDYHGFTLKKGSTDNDLHSGYDNFTIDVEVFYDGDTLGLTGHSIDDNRLAKRITVKVTTPLKTAITFAGYKSNF